MEQKFEIKEDEFEKDGLPYCKNCGKPRFYKIDTGNGIKLIKGMCECQLKKADERREKEEIERRKNIFRERQKLTMLGEKYLNASLDTAKITPSNSNAYERARNYVKNAQQVLSNNIGLYIWGDNSSGKTYLMAAICNALVERGYTCTFTTITKLLAESQRSFRDNGMSQAEIVQEIANKDFLFIDDLGKEFLGSRDYSWNKAEKLLLEVLNARSMSGRPTNFTSNYSLEDFAIKFGLDKAILERVNEMSTRIIKLEGDNFRVEALQEKSKIARGLGI